MKRIFDASAIYMAIEQGLGSKLEGGYTLSIARYELGATIWRGRAIFKRINAEEQKRMANAAEKTLKLMKIVDIEGLMGNVLQTAQETGSSFYDASYIYYSKATGLPLVTEDQRLINRIGKYAKTMKTSEI